MDKKEVIKLLDKEVGLFHEEYEEQEVLTDIEFKEAGEALSELKSERDKYNEALDELRGIIDGNERFTVWKEGDIKEKRIFSPHPIIILGGLIANNIFTSDPEVEQTKWREEKV